MIDPVTTFHRDVYVDGEGRRHSYIVLDRISPPRLVDETRIVRFIGHHTPCAGRCPCCGDTFGTETNSWVLHTTWHARGDVTSVCKSCSTPGHNHGR